MSALGSAARRAGSLVARALGRGPARFDLRGRSVIITGGSRGLGLALARKLAAKGCRLALCARDEGELRAALGELSASGATVMTMRCDVSDPEQVARFVAAVERRYGCVDVLIANAATIQVGPLTAMNLDDFRAAMDGIFWGSVHATLAVLPGMRRRGAGRIVHVGSIGGRVPVPHLSPYTAAKFALTGFSEVAHAELKKDGIEVVTVAPGLMRTGSHLNAEFKGRAEREFSWFSLSLLSRVASIDADRAADSIVAALERGRTQVTLSLPARLLSLAHGVAPGLFTDLMALVDRAALPEDDGRISHRVRGMDLRDRAPGADLIAAAGDGDAEKYRQFPGHTER